MVKTVTRDGFGTGHTQDKPSRDSQRPCSRGTRRRVRLGVWEESVGAYVGVEQEYPKLRIFFKGYSVIVDSNCSGGERLVDELKRISPGQKIGILRSNKQILVRVIKNEEERGD